MRARLLVIAGLVLTAASTAIADDGAGPDWSPFRWMIGTWRCTGSSNLGAGMRPIEASLVTKLDLDGHWLSLRGDAARTKDLPAPIRFQVLLTWSAASKRWDSYVFDNAGTVEQASTPGWEGASATWAGAIHSGDKMFDVAEAWEKKSARELRWSGSVAGQPAWDWTCKKR